MRIVNIPKDQVFNELSKGTEVYCMNVASDTLENLLYVCVDSIHALLDVNHVGFFKIVEESEDE